MVALSGIQSGIRECSRDRNMKYQNTNRKQSNTFWYSMTPLKNNMSS